MIEIEKRVLLTKSQSSKVFKFLKANAKFIKSFKRFTVVHVLNKNFKAAQDTKIDLKLRTTREGGKLALKYGNWHKGSSRQEYEIDFKVDQMPELLNIFLVLGFKYFLMIYIERFEYKFKGLTITLDKYISADKTLMEVEIVASDKKGLSKANKKIDEFLSYFGLTPLDSKGTVEWISYLNNLKSWRVDFTKVTPEAWFKKWKKYVYCQK